MRQPSMDLRVSRLSPTPGPAPPWSIAVFAHNEARRIRAALESIGRAAGGSRLQVVVLVNGCTDRTADEVRACADRVPDLVLVEIARGDKANAWNAYVHDLRSADDERAIETHFFMDGDVRLEPAALPRIVRAFRIAGGVNAIGGMPATGRDREGWRKRMVRHRTIAGNLYALRGTFVQDVRDRNIRMPIGLIGEDWLVSWLVQSRLGDGPSADGQSPLSFLANAEFSFDSLSPWRIRDQRIYLRRKWRYALRGVQMEMLRLHLQRHGMAAMPPLVEDLYRDAPLPSRLRWIGRDSAWRLAAVQWVRRFRSSSPPR